MIKIQVKPFSALTATELYSILQLRSEVFVVEQDCVYQDIDGKDEKALHIIGYKKNKIVAYTRVFAPGDYFMLASIGRVVVSKPERNHNYGYDIMTASIEALRIHFRTSNIQISAQCYLEKFYNSLGFNATGKDYLEDGIPHMTMLYKQ